MTATSWQAEVEEGHVFSVHVRRDGGKPRVQVLIGPSTVPSAWLREVRLSPAEACELAEKLLDAAATAEKKGGG